MAKTVEENAAIVLEALYNEAPKVSDQFAINGEKVQELTGLTPQEINDSVSILIDAAYVEWLQALGTLPFDFSCVWITPRGKLEYERAKEEYEYIPPNEYYKEGYNLYLRMKKYMSNHLLFLHDYRIPTTNNEAERLLRGYKRKQVQAVSFRSQTSIDYLCQCMSMLVMMRRNEEQNVFDRVSRIFG